MSLPRSAGLLPVASRAGRVVLFRDVFAMGGSIRRGNPHLGRREAHRWWRPAP
jgi:hypothetical protein